MYPPERIVCLTEETTETLYLLGEQHRIVGISGYTVRPPQARKEKPRVSAFISADIPKILMTGDEDAVRIGRTVAAVALRARSIAQPVSGGVDDGSERLLFFRSSLPRICWACVTGNSPFVTRRRDM